jgi:hypothetical protein
MQQQTATSTSKCNRTVIIIGKQLNWTIIPVVSWLSMQKILKHMERLASHGILAQNHFPFLSITLYYFPIQPTLSTPTVLLSPCRHLNCVFYKGVVCLQIKLTCKTHDQTGLLLIPFSCSGLIVLIITKLKVQLFRAVGVVVSRLGWLVVGNATCKDPSRLKTLVFILIYTCILVDAFVV